MPRIEDDDDVVSLPKPKKGERKNKKLLAFSWYGGKFSHLKYLLPIIDSVPHVSYVEPFGGSGAVLLNKKPSKIETYNDLFGRVVNFFRVLRDNGDELIRLINLTPYAREEYVNCLTDEGALTDLERARRFFVVARQVTAGLATNAKQGQWSYGVTHVRRDMSGNVSNWLSAARDLDNVVVRLKSVQIECLEAVDVITRYDSPDTLHYVDPPYPKETRSGGSAYKYEYTKKQHLHLLFLLRNVKGRVVLSGYDNEFYSRILSSWNKHELRKIKCAAAYNQSKPERVEIIWTNFDIKEQQCRG